VHLKNLNIPVLSVLSWARNVFIVVSEDGVIELR